METRRILNFLLVIVFLFLPCLTFAGDPTPTTTDPAPPSSPPTLGGMKGGRGAMEFEAGEIIVKFREGISQASVQSLLLAEDMSILDEMAALGFMLLSVPEGQELEKIEELNRNPLVEYAEPNHIIQVANTIAAEPHYSPLSTDVFPNDPYLQWNLPKIEAFAAWDITTGSDKVVIAFVDSGVDLDHPELEDKIWTNPGETGMDTNGNDKASNGIDDDENGYVDDVHGWDFVNRNGYPEDDFWIGTFLSSIAAAETNNGILIAGVSWGAKIMPVKVCKVEEQADGSKKCTSDDWHTAGGIIYAADNGAKIINLGWQVRGISYPHTLQNAVNHAHDMGALIVAGSGDPNPDDPLPPDQYRYPGALDHVVSVAATDREDERPDFSTYNDRVDVAAPGVSVWGVCSPWGFPACTASITPVAAAHVSGLAALIWSVNPNLTNDKVEEIIKSTAVDLGEPGRDDYFGHGRIDASAAVMATPHHLEVKTDGPLYFLVCDDGDPSSREITNPNTNNSTWSATPIDPWLSTSDTEGYTPSSAMVSVIKGALPGHDVYTGTIIATSTMTNCENCLEAIPAIVRYSPKCWRNYLPLLFKNYSSD